MNKIIVILGPTASGKTALSTKLANIFNGEIISADSMQIYRKMNIGTAKVTEEEKNGIKHHLIDIINPSDEFSLAEYIELAQNATEEIIGKGKLPFIVGGTGLYISSFTENINLTTSTVSPEYRDFLNDFAGRHGGNILRKLLKQIDKESFDKLHDADIKRITRALEIYRDSGKTKAENNILSKKTQKYSFCKIGLNYENREKLYQKIDERVDKMMESGLLEEIHSLDINTLSLTASQAIGYKQFFEYLHNERSLEDTIRLIKQESRNYAKRQITWFKREKDVQWYNIDTESSENIYNSCVNYIENFLKI